MRALVLVSVLALAGTALTYGAAPRAPVTDVEWNAVLSDWLTHGKFSTAHSCAAVVVARTHAAPRYKEGSPLVHALDLYEPRLCRFPGNAALVKVGMSNREVAEVAGVPVPWQSAPESWLYRIPGDGRRIYWTDDGYVWRIASASSAARPPISLDANGGFVVGGRPALLIAVSNPPPLWGRTPTGLPGPVEIVRAGVNLVRVGPAWTGWTRRELEQVLAWERTAVLLGVHTWVRLNAFAATQPRWRGDARVTAIVHALTSSRFAAGIGLWQGADEPWSRGIPARSLAFVYCRLTSRGDPRACADEPTLDRHHLLVTILAPSGTPAALAPYSDVTDSLGVDIYPVTLNNADSPDLHMVGVWTRTIAGLTRDHSVWTTLQICSTHAYNKHTGAYVLPSAYQERYMVYDAIINGARGISFFGGDNPHCWNRIDHRYRWNWTFWNRALDPLIEQISSRQALGPALDNAASNDVLQTNDPATEAISRVAVTPSATELWVIAARSNPGVEHVAISGLPTPVKSAAVYGERRTVQVSDGTLSDTFRQWQVHVYRIQLTASQRR